MHDNQEETQIKWIQTMEICLNMLNKRVPPFWYICRVSQRIKIMLLRAFTMVIATAHKGKSLEGIRQSLRWGNTFRGHLEFINKWDYGKHQKDLGKSIDAPNAKLF